MTTRISHLGFTLKISILLDSLRRQILEHPDLIKCLCFQSICIVQHTPVEETSVTLHLAVVCDPQVTRR